MIASRHKSRAGFTLTEVIIGSTLSAMIFAAVLSSYLFLGRQFTRLMHQQTLESQGRRTVLYFTSDAQMASELKTDDSLFGPPTNTKAILVLVTSTGTKNIYYYYNSAATATNVTCGSYTISMPPTALTRVDGSNGTALTLLSNVLTCYFRYYNNNVSTAYDSGAAPYTLTTTYYGNITQLSLLFTTRTGTSTTGTQTPIYQGATERVRIRNKELLE